MKYLITTIAAVLLVGCGESQQTVPASEAKPIVRVAEVKAPDISIHQAAEDGNIEAVKKHLAAGADLNAEDEDGWSLFSCAVNGGHKGIASCSSPKAQM